MKQIKTRQKTTKTPRSTTKQSKQEMEQKIVFNTN